MKEDVTLSNITFERTDSPLNQLAQALLTSTQNWISTAVREAVNDAIQTELQSKTKNRDETRTDRLTKEEVRTMLGVCDNTLYLWRKSGRLIPCAVVGKKIYYSRESIDRLLTLGHE